MVIMVRVDIHDDDEGHLGNAIKHETTVPMSLVIDDRVLPFVDGSYQREFAKVLEKLAVEKSTEGSE